MSSFLSITFLVFMGPGALARRNQMEGDEFGAAMEVETGICDRIPEGPCSPQFKELCKKRCAEREAPQAEASAPVHDGTGICDRLPEGPCSPQFKVLCKEKCAERESPQVKAPVPVDDGTGICDRLPEGPCSPQYKELCKEKCAEREAPQVESSVPTKGKTDMCGRLPDGPCAPHFKELCKEQCAEREPQQVEKDPSNIPRGEDAAIFCKRLLDAGKRCGMAFQFGKCPDECTKLEPEECQGLTSACTQKWQKDKCPQLCDVLAKRPAPEPVTNEDETNSEPDGQEDQLTDQELINKDAAEGLDENDIPA